MTVMGPMKKNLTEIPKYIEKFPLTNKKTSVMEDEEYKQLRK